MTAYWVLRVPAERYADERLFHHDAVALAGADGPQLGDEAILVADLDPPAVFAVGRVVGVEGGLLVAYTRRNLDEPQPAGDLAHRGALTEDEFRAAVARLGPAPDRRAWLVSVDLPIEAETPAEAVRQFWTYVRQLGPGELPAYVAPVGDELAMRAYLLGAQVNLDPEEDED